MILFVSVWYVLSAAILTLIPHCEDAKHLQTYLALLHMHFA